MLRSGQVKPQSPSSPLAPPDVHYLNAAQGWIGLGNHHEADVELQHIDTKLHAHPDVLLTRLEIYAHAGNWLACVMLAAALTKLAPANPEGWVQRSFALHRLRRTQEAFNQLLPAVAQFPKEWIIPYNLACFCARLGRDTDAEAWLKQALAIDESRVRSAAMEDPDLRPLWDRTSSTLWGNVC